MHDLDRTTLESNFEYDAFDSSHDEAETLGEDELDELAGELLGAASEAELDHFLGGMFGKLEGFASKLLPASLKQHLRSGLKGIAGKLLPMAGGALGNLIAPGIGGMIGSQAGSSVGSALGLELEGLSSEEQAFQIARGFVKLGAAAILYASQATGADPRTIARQALQLAVQRHAPGLIRRVRPALPAASAPAAPTPRPAVAPAPSAPAAPPASHGELLSEADEMELAAELMEVTTEAEVDHFLGGVLGAVDQMLGKTMTGPIGNAVGGYLKQLAAGALPRVARAAWRCA